MSPELPRGAYQDKRPGTLSGPYTLEITGTSAECAGRSTSVEATVTVDGTDPNRTVSFQGISGDALAGPLTEDLTFEVSVSVAGGGDFDVLGVTTTMSGKFDIHENNSVTVAGIVELVLEGGTCTFDLSGYQA